MHCHGGAVQILLADHTQEAGFMEAVALALDLLSKVDRLLAYPTFLASSPVWHSGSCWEAHGRQLSGFISFWKSRLGSLDKDLAFSITYDNLISCSQGLSWWWACDPVWDTEI